MILPPFLACFREDCFAQSELIYSMATILGRYMGASLFKYRAFFQYRTSSPSALSVFSLTDPLLISSSLFFSFFLLGRFLLPQSRWHRASLSSLSPFSLSRMLLALAKDPAAAKYRQQAPSFPYVHGSQVELGCLLNSIDPPLPRSLLLRPFLPMDTRLLFACRRSPFFFP